MKRLLMIAAILIAGTGHLCAQTATGIGIGTARSTSGARSTAISGQGGGGGSVTLDPNGISPQTTTTITSNSTVPANQKVSTVPSVFAPGLAAAGLETCLGSVSVGASWLGTGLTGGGSIPDAGCAARLDARTLWSMGLKKAAVARLCLNPDIYRSMPDVCGTYLPVAPTAYAIAPVAPVAYSEPAYVGGDIWLTEGKTGKDRLCHDYDTTKQRCRAWDGVVMHQKKSGAHTATTAALKEPK